MTRFSHALLIVAASALLVGAAALTFTVDRTGLQGFDGSIAVHRLGSVPLVNDRGERIVIGRSARGTVVVLGYTRCRDECPLTVSRLALALSAVKRGRRPDAFFVTVEPRYDTPSVLHRYLRPWSGLITGVTGRTEDLHAFYADLGSFDPGSRYRDHDTRVFILNQDGYVAQELSPEASPEQLQAGWNASATPFMQ